jgi:inositol phosphorylceramide mannosyltransferase catalytic subunit
MLWTDASSREFIANEYPWFLDTFDGYTYPIQRADAIRYFILYHYGGIYIDLDIGCEKRLDSLLSYSVILPRTKPVGVSNDLIFSEKKHPFMAQTIHSLISWDYSWILNYPTVMFSTGPMFLSFQYGSWNSANPPTAEFPGGEVRILPKALYGKNALPEEVPNSFFSHYYGSSWHADDAAFIGFLGTWGKALMWVGLVVLVLGLIRLVLAPHRRQSKFGRVGGYDVLMPRWKKRNNRWYLDLGLFTIPSSAAGTPNTSPSPLSLSSDDEEEVQLLPLSLSVPPSSPLSEDGFFPQHNTMLGSMRRAANGFMSMFSSNRDTPSTPSRLRRGRLRRGVLFFLPALSVNSHELEVSTDSSLSRNLSRSRPSRASSREELPPYPADKARPREDSAAGQGSGHLLVPLGYELGGHSRSSTNGSSSSESLIDC